MKKIVVVLFFGLVLAVNSQVQNMLVLLWFGIVTFSFHQAEQSTATNPNDFSQSLKHNDKDNTNKTEVSEYRDALKDSRTGQETVHEDAGQANDSKEGGPKP